MRSRRWGSDVPAGLCAVAISFSEKTTVLSLKRWQTPACLQLQPEGVAPASHSSHSVFMWGPPQWLHFTVFSTQNRRPWPYPRHSEHCTSGDWSATRTRWRSMTTERLFLTPGSHPSDAGTQASWKFPADAMITAPHRVD